MNSNSRRFSWLVFVLIAIIGGFFIFQHIKDKDFSKSTLDIETISYQQNATINLQSMANNTRIDSQYVENDFDFSSYPENFILKGTSYAIYPFSDTYIYSAKLYAKPVPNKILENFEIAKKLVKEFSANYNFPEETISQIDQVSMECGELYVMEKTEGNLFLYHNGMICVDPSVFSDVNINLYSDEQFVQMIVAELLKMLQETTLGKRNSYYFNEYMSSLIAASICGTEIRGEHYQQCLAFIKAVGSSEALEAYFFGFDPLINSGKIKEAELQVFLSLTQVLNTCIGGQSQDLYIYESQTNLSRAQIENIALSITTIWSNR